MLSPYATQTTGQHEPAPPNGILISHLISVQSFLQCSRVVTNSCRLSYSQTDHDIVSVAIGHIYAMHAIWPTICLKGQKIRLITCRRGNNFTIQQTNPNQKYICIIYASLSDHNTINKLYSATLCTILYKIT